MPRIFFVLLYETVSERCTLVCLGMLHAHTFTVAQPSYNDSFTPCPPDKQLYGVPLPKGIGRY